MGLNCKICNTELDALAGGRCRKCRQLVCGDCIASGSADSDSGILCKACVDAGEEAEAVTPKNEPEVLKPVEKPQASVVNTPAHPASKWVWALFVALMAGVFMLIVLLPGIMALYWGGQLVSKDKSESRAAATKLVEIGGDAALGQLTQVALSGPEHARIAAIDALGEFPSPKAGEPLQVLVDDVNTSDDLRLAAKDALLRHRRLYLK